MGFLMFEVSSLGISIIQQGDEWGDEEEEEERTNRVKVYLEQASLCIADTVLVSQTFLSRFQ